MKNKKRSLMLKLMIWINIISVLIILALSGAIMFNMMKSTEQMITKEMETLATSVKLTSSDYVWNLNNEVLKTITTQLLEDPSIEAVKFIDTKNVVITEAKENDLSKNTREIRLPIIYGADKQTIAFIEFKYNLNKVERLKNEFLKMTFFGILVAQVLMCLILFFVLRKTTTKLGTISEKLRGVTQKNQISSDVVQRISEEVSASTQEQASSIQQTVSTLDQITSMVNTSVESAQNSSKKAEESHRIASEGQGVVREMIFSMEEINKSNFNIMDEIQKSNERMGGIVKVINEISQKTSVINDIVFQTKLLSFNASVEAARAGEHGKGFSIVAEEVGNLARMSGDASNEISQMLGVSIKKVNEIITDTNRNIQGLIEVGNKKVKDGVVVADKCGKVLEEVVVNASIVKNMMNEVSLACKEQAEGVKNIALAMSQLDQTTLNNADTAQRSFESSKELSLQADELRSNVQDLELEIFGSNGLKIETIKPVQIKEEILIEKKTEKTKHVNNVIELPKAQPVILKAAPLTVNAKKANGSVSEIPSANDQRFEEV